jgi:F0F1-type ATP synthase assembly protein I
LSQDPNLRNTANLMNTVGQAGCATGVVAILIIALAFGAGWLLDDLLGNERRFLTIGFLLLSFPVTLFVMVRISLFIVGRANKQANEIEQEKYEKKDDTIT